MEWFMQRVVFPWKLLGYLSGMGKNFIKASELQPLVHTALTWKSLSFIPKCYSFFLISLLPHYPHPNHLRLPTSWGLWSTTLQKGNDAQLLLTKVEKQEDIIKERRRKEASTYCFSTICQAQREALYKYAVFNPTTTLWSRHYHHRFTTTKCLQSWDVVMVMLPATIFGAVLGGL